jgi:uncharacterized protein DUF3311
VRQPFAGQPAGMREDDSARKRWYWLLVIPLVGVLIPPIYNHEDPTLIGIPFFYWYQLLWVPISVVVTAVVYRRATAARDRGGER